MHFLITACRSMSANDPITLGRDPEQSFTYGVPSTSRGRFAWHHRNVAKSSCGAAAQ